MSVNRRDLAWYLAGILSAAAIAFFVWLMSPSPPQGTLVSAAPSATSTPSAAPPAMSSQGASPEAVPQAATQPAGSMNESLVRLEARLASQGGTDADWELLAQTYEFMGRAADAQGARAHHLPGASGASGASGATGATGATSSTIAAMPAARPATAVGVPTGAAQLEGVVELADAIKSKVPAGLTLFIVAKDVGSPGPPVGVMRTTTGQWPVPFRLDDASAMVPGRTLSGAGSVTVEARVSRSGMAAPQPGDFQSGVITVNPHDAKSVRLLIDHVIG
jgi:hypothetical protein